MGNGMGRVTRLMLSGEAGRLRRAWRFCPRPPGSWTDRGMRLYRPRRIGAIDVRAQDIGSSMGN